MSRIIQPIRPIELREIQEARQRIAKTIVRRPLLRLDLGPDFPISGSSWKNLQPVNPYKLRGVANALAMLSEADSAR